MGADTPGTDRTFIARRRWLRLDNGSVHDAGDPFSDERDRFSEVTPYVAPYWHALRRRESHAEIVGCCLTRCESILHRVRSSVKEPVMTTAADQLLSALMHLSPVDRGEVAAQLLESLDPVTEPDADAAWAEEIRIRVEDVQAGRVKGVSWTEARAQILADRDGGS